MPEGHRGVRPRHNAGKGTIIVFGNEKGGTGKSTTAMHVIVALLREGYRVGAVDLDARQGTLTRYFDNRRIYAARQGLRLPHPVYRTVARSELRDRFAAEKEERDRLARALAGLAECDFIVLDTPGSDLHLSREGHFYADILITPLNDSPVDIDVLAHVDWEQRVVEAPSVYCRFVWECRDRRNAEAGAGLDWIVVRSRVGHAASHNKRDVTALMDVLSQNIGFRLAGGFGERVVFRELFARGLTLLDDPATSASHRAARDELDALVSAIGAPALAAA